MHLLAAEPAAHAQALHGDFGGAPAEHVRDDLLRLGGVLGARLHEDLPALVDERERAVGLQVELLLPGELELAAEHVRRLAQRGVDVAANHPRLCPLEAVGGDRLGDLDVGRQRLGLDDDGGGAEPGGLERLAEHPADRMTEEHDLLGREQRLVVLDARVVDPALGHVGRGQHPDDTRHRQCRLDVDRDDPGVRVRRLHGIGVQHVLRAIDQVIGVERLAGHVQDRRLVRDRDPDRRALGPRGELTHVWSPIDLVMPGLRRAWPPGGRRTASAGSSSASPRGNRCWPGGRSSGCPRRPGSPRPR